MPVFTLIVPYYRNVSMLDRQLIEWEQYPHKHMRIVVVDDGSPEPAASVIQMRASEELLKRIRVYRITVDIPWNREGARNLASQESDADWLVHVDIDHILPAKACIRLIDFDARPGSWYRFPRFRQGRADETRMKDDLPRDTEFGRIKPHIDSYLVERAMYWKAGGYDEDYAGCLGGGSEFLRRLEHTAGAPKQVPDPICLHVYTRDKIKDASDWSLSRDTSHGKAITRRKDLAAGPGKSLPENPIRFPWVREL